MTEFDDVYDHFVALAGAPDIADPNEAARSDAYAEVAAVPGVVADDGDTAIQDGAGGGLLLPWWAWGSIAVAVVTALCGVSKVRAKARGARESGIVVDGDLFDKSPQAVAVREALERLVSASAQYGGVTFTDGEPVTPAIHAVIRRSQQLFARLASKGTRAPAKSLVMRPGPG